MRTFDKDSISDIEGNVNSVFNYATLNAYSCCVFYNAAGLILPISNNTVNHSFFI
nr:MAG TPA: hypothetical protein [Crassvirales sp.]